MADLAFKSAKDLASLVRRRKIGCADESIEHLPALHLRAPAHGQGNAGAGIVDIGLAAREGHSMIAGHHDDGVFELV